MTQAMDDRQIRMDRMRYVKNTSSSLPSFRLRHNRLFPSSERSLASLRHLLSLDLLRALEAAGDP